MRDKFKFPVSAFEKQLADTVSAATFPLGSGAKRFIRDIHSGYIQQLTDNGRHYLAYIAHRFRKQYSLSAEQWVWVNERLNHDQNKAESQGATAQGSGSLFLEEAVSEAGREGQA